MKKYAQIIVVLGAFFLLVMFRNLKGGDAAPVVSVSHSDQSQQATPTVSSGSSGSGSSTPSQSSTAFKDGTYQGDPEDAYYGTIQVSVTISGGKISDIQFLQYPNDNGTSIQINQEAMSTLKQEAIQAQSSQVDIVSGASDSSQAFQQSLQTALSKAS